MKNRVNCWKPKMAISSQAEQKCAEGSETRLNVLTGFYVNSSVECKGYENPRAPDNQAMQQMWSLENFFGFLRKKSFKAMQVVSTGTVKNQLPKKQKASYNSDCKIQKRKSAKNKIVFAKLVFGKQRPYFESLQRIQRAAGGKGA